MVDPSADRQAVALHADLARSVRRVCPRRLADQRDDLIQGAMMRVLGVLRASVRSRNLTSGYLRRVAQSALCDEIRRRRRRHEVALEDEVTTREPIARSFEPDRLAASAEIGRAIVSGLGELNPARRVAVILYLQGHTVPEAARLLGWTAKKTENLVYRGLTSLRRSLVAKGFGA